MKKLLLFMIGTLLTLSAYGQSNLPPCQGSSPAKWHNCFGAYTYVDGGKYVGEFKDGKYHGQGSYTFVDGTSYVGEWKYGKYHGQGSFTAANGDKYVGAFKDNKYNGQGTATFVAGDKYVGGWKDDKRNGQGTYTRANGTGFIGEWVDGLPNGRGIETYADGQPTNEGVFEKGKFVRAEKINSSSRQTDLVLNEDRRSRELAQDTESKLQPCQGSDLTKWSNCFGTFNDANGNKYLGEFADGKYHGHGTCTFTSGEKYVGDWKDGKSHGQGTYTFADGGKYVGGWKDNAFHGYGSITSPKGYKFVGTFKDGEKNGQGSGTSTNGEKFVGEFKDDKMNGQGTYTYANGNKYVGDWKDGKKNRQGTFTWADGEKYDGEYKDGKQHGQGTYTRANGTGFTGEWADGLPNGRGIETYADGRPASEGLFDQGKFVRAEKINLPNQQTDLALNEERRRLEADRQAVAEDRRRLDEERRNREQAKQSSKLSIQASATVPDANGFVVITIQTNADTSSLKINGEEQGGRQDGSYTVKRVARVGQETIFTVIATAINGNTDTKTVAVTRQAASTDITYAALNPVNIKQQPSRDAVAIIIGIQNYKRVAKAPYANDDARAFYDYAIRALGIKPQNIKLLVDEEADEIEIIQAFENWLPVHVNKNKTEVYVFYAGHGLPSTDGKSLYFLPYGVDKQYLARTAVGQKEVIAALAASKPKTVTMFIDACYSGSTRSGEILIADARPVNLKVEQGIYPPNFTVISASANDQISSSSPELKHGIFSFYLMKGMEGDADGNKDGKITVGEMQEYLSDKVSRQAMTKNAQQDTQLVGDATRVLVTR